MRDAIQSGKGVVGCRVAVAGINAEKQQIFRHVWKGVQNITNLEFMAEKVMIWKAYGIGNENSIPMSEVLYLSLHHCPTIIYIGNYIEVKPLSIDFINTTTITPVW